MARYGDAVRRSFPFVEGVGADGGDGARWLTLPLPRLLHSLTNLKRVIINAAHYLVLGDKDTYHNNPAAPFLGMVRSALARCSPCSQEQFHAAEARKRAPACPMSLGPAGGVIGRTPIVYCSSPG